MARPVVGIYASIARTSFGPWVDRPSLVAPAALGAAVQGAGAIAVVLAPDPALERPELLDMLDALVVRDDADGLQALLGAARERGLATLVLAAEQASSVDELTREVAGVLER
jgi:hypothetical protein